jgi:hypothetical protein
MFHRPTAIMKASPTGQPSQQGRSLKSTGPMVEVSEWAWGRACSIGFVQGKPCPKLTRRYVTLTVSVLLYCCLVETQVQQVVETHLKRAVMPTRTPTSWSLVKSTPSPLVIRTNISACPSLGVYHSPATLRPNVPLALGREAPLTP